MKKLIIILCCLFLAGGAVIYNLRLSAEENQNRMNLKICQEEIDDLNQEKRVLEKELLNIRIQEGTIEESSIKEESKNYLPQYCLAFVSPTKSFYKELQSAMDGYNQSGVLVFTDQKLPGSDEGSLSEKNFGKLVQAGWMPAVSVDSLVDFSMEQEAVEKNLKEELFVFKSSFAERLNVSPEIVWFDQNHFKTWMEPVLKELGFTAVICADTGLKQGEAGINLVPVEKYMNISSDYIRGNYVHYQMLAMDCRPEADGKALYDSKRFHEILDYMIRSSGEGKLSLDKAENFFPDSEDEARVIRNKAKEHAEALAKIQEKSGLGIITEEALINRIAEIENEIKKLYKE